MAAPLSAQEANTQAAQARPSGALEEVVVAGSRIAREDFTHPTPVTTYGEDQILDRAPTNIGSVVNQMPALRQTATTGQSQRGASNNQNNPDLRGLGPERTLVLVNGQRVVPTNLTGTVDLNLIPTQLVERVELVTGGASAAYGSDAVAGVVNIVLREKLDEVKASATYGISQEGDNEEYAFTFAAGHNLFADRANLMIGVDYSKSLGVKEPYARDWGRMEGGLVSYGAARPAGAPSRAFLTNVENSSLYPGGLVTSGPLKGVAFGEGGVPFTFPFGQVYGNVMVGSTGNYGISPFTHYFIEPPLERVSSLGRLTFDVSDAVSVFVDASYAKSEMSAHGSNQTLQNLVIGADNPFIPASVQQQMQSLGLPTITLWRNAAGINTGSESAISNTTKRLVLGGRAELGSSGDWKLDTYYQKGETDYRFDRPNMLIYPNFYAAINTVVAPNGTYTCGPLDTNPNLTAAFRSYVEPGCVPLNIFGADAPSAGARDYVTTMAWQKALIKQDAAAINLSGEPFDTWAGPVSIATGLEWRRDELDNKSDPLSNARVLYSNRPADYSGKSEVSEVYGETVVPLVRNAGFAKAIDFNGAFRYTDYELSGAVNTWKAGLTYDVSNRLRFRSALSRDIRAPNLTELFSPASTGFITTVNPFNNATGRIQTLTAGNLALDPEIARTLTAGVVVQPDIGWLSDLSLAVDYFKIRVEDAITSLTAPQILNGCFEGISEYCDAIGFDDSAVGIAQVRTQPFNASKFEVNGVDFTADYVVPLGSLPGRLRAQALATWINRYETNAPNGNFNYAGELLNGMPKWNYQLNLTYDLGSLGAIVQLRGFSASKYDVNLIGPDQDGYDPALPNSINDNTFPSYTYLNVGLRYEVPLDSSGLELFLNIDNLLNKGPPIFAAPALSAASGNPYDLIGRRMRMGARFRF